MPLFAPRSEPTKKREQLQQREKELALAIKNQVTDDKLEKLAEKYRQAQLSLLKAQLHAIQEMDFQGKKTTLKQGKIEQEILIYSNKLVAELISEVQKLP
ncbi:hypothetical protein [Chitinophaga ginsengisoli]|uniref:Uncharacterized protein n=1 Tax=Chitinophaga ginsengisoli TaxID=363837 RepID=A0A2P8FNR4_9BACT|nr:hypothetical protein [Chitinophaga ginsengisoli]PSL23371.1 hypothetical protein CLV42_11888 [Chitinophaga ginsengisoli]